MAEKTISLSNLTAYNDNIKATYQAKTDSSLATTNKTVVGAINENKTQLDNISTQRLDNKSIKVIETEEEWNSLTPEQQNDSNMIYIKTYINEPRIAEITTNDKGKILAAKADGTGTEWIEKPTGGSGVSLGETSTTAYRGDRGKIAYDHSQVAHVTIDDVNISTNKTYSNTKINTTYATKQELQDLALESGNILLRDIVAGEIFVLSSGGTTPVYGQIVLNKTSISITEGSSGTFTVALDKAPTNNQVVSLSKTNADVTLSPATLTFTPSNYATAQSVTITVAEDNTDYSNETDTITLTSPNVTTKTVSVSITDNDTAPSNIPVTGVTVAPTTATITTIGGTQQLTATIQPVDATNKAVTWSSSNTGIATVDSTGKVTSVANGSATITCTAQDTTNVANASCSITVNQQVTPTDDLLLDYDFTTYQDLTTTFTDLSGNGHDGTFVNPQTTGNTQYHSVNNGMLVFNAKNSLNGGSKISVANLVINKYPFTVELYIKQRKPVLFATGSVDESWTSTTGVFFNSKSGSGSGYGYSLEVYYNSNKLGIVGSLSSPSISTDNNTYNAFDGTWKHVVCVFEANQQKFYVNGALIKTDTQNGTNIGSSTREIQLLENCPGYYKRIRIYSKAVSQSEISNKFIELGGGN